MLHYCSTVVVRFEDNEFSSDKHPTDRITVN